MNTDINCITLCRGISDIASQNTLKAEPSRCNKELGDPIRAMSKVFLPGNFDVAASLMLWKTWHITVGQAIAEQVMAANILFT